LSSSATIAGGAATDFPISITNSPLKGAYPISTFTYLLIPRKIADPDKKAALLGFLKWMLADGQKTAPELFYAPLPKPVLAKKLSSYDPEKDPRPVCGAAEWQREPLRVTFHTTGKDAAGFDVVPGSAVLVEDAGDEAETK